jgi:omega-6 fatty acid desaturase (delta-12 desaturase)
MSSQPVEFKKQVTHSDWYKSLTKFEKSDIRKTSWQLINTLVPYAISWIVMVLMLNHYHLPYYTIVPVLLVSSGFLVRVFIIFHDCGHGSFYDSKRLNAITGYITGVLVFTPYEEWKHAHAVHHATVGDLERRGSGDIWTMTVEEYLTCSKWKRLGYRMYRNPLILFVLGPPGLFIIAQRFPTKGSGKMERRSVVITDIALAALVGLASITIGLKTYLLIQIPLMTLAGIFGVWLFYVQHQYLEVYWERHQKWDPIRAALEGSSYYKLPKVLQWFSGNIGLHHIHHLRPRIPNYNLQQSYDEVPALRAIEPLTIGRSFRSLFMHLWDENQKKMVSCWSVRNRLKGQAT